MITPKLQLKLEAGEEQRGRFWVGGHPESATAGVLRWSREDGAELRLIGPFQSCPAAGTEHLTIHGFSVEDGTDLTLPSALITQSGIGGAAYLTVKDPTLILEVHLAADDTWKRTIVRTAHLHEWLPVTGFEGFDWDSDRHGARRATLAWKRPRGILVDVTGARLRFGVRMDTEEGWQPDRSIRTAMDVVSVVKERAALDDLHRRYAIPVLSLMILTSGRPDNLTYEAVLRGRRERAVVLRRGLSATPRESRPLPDFLFYARELPDFRRSIQRWFRLHKRCSPALDVFAESINEGSVYSPSRLLSVASALESYHRVIHERQWWRSHPNAPRLTLLQRITDLQARSGVPEAATGFTKRNRKLFVAARNYFTHLEGPHYGFSLAEVHDGGWDCIRRGVALMQANVMRRLGFTGAQARNHVNRHYRNWPVPQ